MSMLKNAHALLIGVGNDLPVTVRDATALYNLLADPAYGGYALSNITLLTEEAASREGILNAFDTLIEKTDEDASVFLFYSGHGGTFTTNDLAEVLGTQKVEEALNRDHFYIQPSDCTEATVLETIIKAEEISEKIKQLSSRRLIFLLDCCHAAGITRTMRFDEGYSPQNTMHSPEGLAQKIDDGMGMSIISSCREDQESFILEGDINSLFTKCLLEVLKAEHKEHIDEPVVRISEVIQYLFRAIPARKPIQRPYANIQIYDDFVVSKVPQERLAATDLSPSLEGSSSLEVRKSPPLTAYRKRASATMAIIFVHGFSGEAANSFGKLPQLLMEEEALESWDMFPLGFSAAIQPEMGKTIWATVENIQAVADYLKTSIRYKFGQYSRVAIIGYSLGGLVAQRTLLDLHPADRNRISHCLLFASPNGGIHQEITDKKLQQRILDLHPDGTFVSDLRKEWKALFATNYPFKCKVIAATEDAFIPIDSVFADFDKAHQLLIAGDHFSMVRSETTEDDAYQIIKAMMTDTTFLHRSADTVAIHLAIGDYELVIKKLLPNVDALDKRGLEKLIYALEGTGREEEALTIVAEHPLAKENSDLQGIIGGRYKRAYLKSFNQVDGEKAYQHYKTGLTMATTQHNRKQRFYHAINLAFLELVLKENEAAMLSYAAIAKEEASQCIDNLWKLATMGEAHVYLGNFEKAKEFYQQVAALANIREKIAIHTNGYMAYTTLMETENPEDSFIKFLKTNFLS